jgi:hypothetical protein
MNSEPKDEKAIDNEAVNHKYTFVGEAKIGEVMTFLKDIKISPEDLSSPVAFQMALSRIYDAVMRNITRGPNKTYIAEVRFTDSMGNRVVFAVDLGPSPPPVSSARVKAKITIEFFEDG